MRALLPAALVLAVSACQGGGAAPDAAAGALTADLLPFEASSAAFTNARDGTPRTLRVVPSADGRAARLVLEAPGGAAPGEIRVTRRDDSLWFSADVDLGTELIRIGAAPGAAWESQGRRVRFEGWESLPLGASNVEAARIVARRGPAGLERAETWWFARGVGLVRLKPERGSMSPDELVRVAR
jgi:hypothetical protein